MSDGIREGYDAQDEHEAAAERLYGHLSTEELRVRLATLEARCAELDAEREKAGKERGDVRALVWKRIKAQAGMR